MLDSKTVKSDLGNGDSISVTAVDPKGPHGVRNLLQRYRNPHYPRKSSIFTHRTSML